MLYQTLISLKKQLHHLYLKTKPLYILNKKTGEFVWIFLQEGLIKIPNFLRKLK